jgi:hypothetical protein
LIDENGKAMNDTPSTLERTPFQSLVAGRFGVLPNFFRSGAAAPGLIERLWEFACAAYLDNPLPSLFKERLFVYLSQFCPVRYCIVRHVGFLIGRGRPAGDAEAPTQTIEQVITMLRRPRPDLSGFDQAVRRLLERPTAAEMPEADTEFENDLFDALTLLFLTPLASLRARDAIRAAVGETKFEYLAAFLVFIRAAHYWTETHPEVEIEADMRAVMEANRELERILMHGPETGRPPPL